MQPKALISSTAIAFVSLIVSSSFWVKPAAAQETTFALCEAANYTVRVYSSNGQTLMRAYDRQQNVVWMNQTPVSTEAIPQGTVYTNTRGEQTVKLLVNHTSNSCTIQVGTRSPQTGQLLSSSPNPESTLDQVRQLYPEQVAKLEADCRPPNTLSVVPNVMPGRPQRATFNCWSQPEASGARSGQWLGTLPLTASDPTFAKPMTCSAGDTQCQAHLTLIQSRYPQPLQQAEFSCAMKNGTLFFAPGEQAIDMRCGYFATSLYDENGDGQGYLEQPTGVDISVGTVPLPG